MLDNLPSSSIADQFISETVGTIETRVDILSLKYTK